jgi:hypothetical protein
MEKIHRRAGIRTHCTQCAKPVMLRRGACESALRALLMPEGAATFTVEGGSMSPFLAPGMRVRLKPRSMPLKPGGCYAFMYKKRLVVHRLVALRGREALFAGDHARRYERIDVESVVGELDCRNSRVRSRVVAMTNRVFLHGRRWFPLADRWRSRLVGAAAGTLRGEVAE